MNQIFLCTILLLSYRQYEPHSAAAYSLLTSPYWQYEPHSTASRSLLTSAILDLNLSAAITLSEIFSWLKKTFRLCFSLYVKWGTLSAKRLSYTSDEKQRGNANKCPVGLIYCMWGLVKSRNAFS